jgi:hypothetical protein
MSKVIRHALIISSPNTLELVEDTIILIQITQFTAKMIVNRNRLDWSALHIDIPYLQTEVIAGENISSIMAKLDVGNRGDDFRKE